MTSFFSLWLAISIMGILTLPISVAVFGHLPDKGYGFSKTLGLVLVGYGVWITCMLGMAPFSAGTILLIAGILGIVSLALWTSESIKATLNSFNTREMLQHILTSEIIFLVVLVFFTILRSGNPDIVATEKPMDFAFLNAIVRSAHFPPADPWFAGTHINYYYFGHYLLALIAVITTIPTSIMYTLGLALVFALSAQCIYSFSTSLLLSTTHHKLSERKLFLFGLTSVALVLLVGNLDSFIVFLQNPLETIQKSWWAGIGWNSSRVVGRAFENNDYITINEFPYFSFILGDLHAHVLALPLVLLSLGTVFAWVTKPLIPAEQAMKNVLHSSLKILADKKQYVVALASILVTAVIFGSLIPTNIWDFPMISLVFLVAYVSSFALVPKKSSQWVHGFFGVIIILAVALLAYFPFLLTFVPIKAIGDPKPLVNVILPWVASSIGTWTSGYGFSPVESVGRLTTLPELCTIWGLFFLATIPWIALSFWKSVQTGAKKSAPTTRVLLYAILGILTAILFTPVVGFLLVLLCISAEVLCSSSAQPTKVFVVGLFIVGLVLLLTCELIFINDFFSAPLERMNTVFKFYYQSWIILGLCSGYALYELITIPMFSKGTMRAYTLLFGFVFLASFSYPVIATFARLRDTSPQNIGIDGEKYLQTSPSASVRADAEAIQWLQAHVPGNPTIIEAHSEAEEGGNARNSYSYGARISAFTGLPTVIGWYSSHENLWRNSAPEIAIRVSDVETFYMSKNTDEASTILKRYNVQYIINGELERKLFPQGDFQKLSKLGDLVYKNDSVEIYKVFTAIAKQDNASAS